MRSRIRPSRSPPRSPRSGWSLANRCRQMARPAASTAAGRTGGALTLADLSRGRRDIQNDPEPDVGRSAPGRRSAGPYSGIGSSAGRKSGRAYRQNRSDPVRRCDRSRGIVERNSFEVVFAVNGARPFVTVTGHVPTAEQWSRSAPRDFPASSLPSPTPTSSFRSPWPSPTNGPTAPSNRPAALSHCRAVGSRPPSQPANRLASSTLTRTTGWNGKSSTPSGILFSPAAPNRQLASRMAAGSPGRTG